MAGAQRSDPTNKVAAILSIVAVLLALAWVLFFVGANANSAAHSASTRANPTGSTSSAAATRQVVSLGGQAYEVCSPGQCATNLYNGVKRCSSAFGVVLANAEYEVCSAAQGCDNLLLPFALQPNQGTNYDGLCPPGVNCACLSQTQCPEYVLAGFRTSTGDPYQPAGLSSQRLSFEQFTPDSQPGANSYSIVISNPSVEFCSVPPVWLNQSAPGCPGLGYGDVKALVACMGQPRGCDGETSSPCSRGTLALLPRVDTSRLTVTDLFSSQVGCVRGAPCGCGLVAIWDEKLGAVICKDPASITV